MVHSWHTTDDMSNKMEGCGAAGLSAIPELKVTYTGTNIVYVDVLCLHLLFWLRIVFCVFDMLGNTPLNPSKFVLCVCLSRCFQFTLLPLGKLKSEASC